MHPARYHSDVCATGTVRRFYNGYQRKNITGHCALRSSRHSMLAIRSTISFHWQPNFCYYSRHYYWFFITQVLHVGWVCLPAIISTIATSLIIAFIIFLATHIDSNTAVLIGVGSSICGGSAIAAAAPVVKASDQDIAQAISVVFFFNVVAAFVFPPLGDAIGLSNMGFGLFAGTAVNDTSSVTATAAVWDSMKGTGTQVLEYATIVKLTRTLAIIPICLGLASYQVYKAKQAAKASENAEPVNIAAIFPKFVLYFVICSLITTVLSYANVDIHFLDIFKTISKYFITMAMVAIGLNTNLVKLIKSGGSALALGAACWIAIALVSLGMQHVIGLW